MVKKREIVTCVLLSLITCGIYGIVWFINLTDDVSYLSEDTEFSGAKSFLFTIITCGIYGFFWSYRLGKDIYKAQIKHNLHETDNSTLFIILQLFGLGLVTYCLAQNDINEMANKDD